MTTGARGLTAPRWLPRRALPTLSRRREEPAPLAFAREKKLLLGTLSLLVALPLPMNEPQPQGVVSWAVLALHVAAVSFFLRRTWRGRGTPLPSWTMNLAGLAYLPLFVMRLDAIGRVHIARPMVELLLFGLVMRLYGLRREREKWHVAVLLFFLFIAAMATSVHPLILIYLLAAMMLWLVLLLRFLQLHLEETYPLTVSGSRLRPQHLLVAFALLTVLGALPFFALLPRMRSPYIMGGGAGGRTTWGTGFRDEVDLNVVGSIRENQAVALRMKPEDATFPPPALLRGTTYDEFRDNSWLRSQAEPNVLLPAATNLYRLADGPIQSKMRIWLEPIDTRSLVLPVETKSVELSHRLLTDIAGGIMMLQSRTSILEYRVGVGSTPVYRAEVPRLDDPSEPTLHRGGITPRIDDLARTLAADHPPEQAAQRILQYLQHNFVYTLDFLGRRADQPIEDFLFRYRSGHCEYFATSMILMLRSVGIPARLATGFLGAEFNPLEDYYVVRQSNAHAWVEAYLPGVGWTTFDPTPPSGRPAVGVEPTLAVVLRQAWDYFEFRWDRYVMAYGFLDQIGFLLRLRDFLQRIGSHEDGGRLQLDRGRETGGRIADPSAPTGLEVGRSVILAALVVLALMAVGLWVRARVVHPLATRSYRELRTAAARRDPAIGAATGPLALRDWFGRHLPAAHGPVASVIDLYLLESYRGARLGRAEAATVRRELRRARRALRGAPRRPAGRPTR